MCVCQNGLQRCLESRCRGLQHASPLYLIPHWCVCCMDMCRHTTLVRPSRRGPESCHLLILLTEGDMVETDE